MVMDADTGECENCRVHGYRCLFDPHTNPGAPVTTGHFTLASRCPRFRAALGLVASPEPVPVARDQSDGSTGFATFPRTRSEAYWRGQSYSFTFRQLGNAADPSIA